MYNLSIVVEVYNSVHVFYYAMLTNDFRLQSYLEVILGKVQKQKYWAVFKKLPDENQ